MPCLDPYASAYCRLQTANTEQEAADARRAMTSWVEAMERSARDRDEYLLMEEESN